MDAMWASSLLRRGALFVLIGMVLYAGVYAGSEALIYRHAVRNRFYTVRMASSAVYDYVILGASHALPFDFGDTNALLEKATGTRIINLAMPGAGIVPNRLLLEYFLARHRTKHVIYMLDSFVFCSRDWNEDRLRDVRLMQRAPFDPDLARLLLAYASRGLISPGVVIDYVSAFSKINDADRFRPDVLDMEAQFGRVFRLSTREAQKRVEYLYPKNAGCPAVDRYVAMFSDLIGFLEGRGIPVIVVKPPVPAYFYQLLPGEDELTRRIAGVVAGSGVFYDFSQIDNDERFFLDTDHFNRDGVLNFFDRHLQQILLQYRD